MKKVASGDKPDPAVQINGLVAPGAAAKPKGPPPAKVPTNATATTTAEPKRGAPPGRKGGGKGDKGGGKGPKGAGKGGKG